MTKKKADDSKESKKSKNEKEVLSLKDRLKKEQIMIRVVVEVMGAPKPYVEKAVQKVIDKLEEQPFFLELVSEEIFEAEEVEDEKMKGKIFSAVAEVELWITGMEGMLSLAYDFMPAAIEILQPTELTLPSMRVTDFVTEMLGRLHQADSIVKNERMKNQVVGKNLTHALRNFTMYLLRDKDLTPEDISKNIGIPFQQTIHLLTDMTKQGIIERTKDKKHYTSLAGKK